MYNTNPSGKLALFKFVCLLSFLISANTSFARSSWVPGYVVANNGDTITGTLSYKYRSAAKWALELKKTGTDNKDSYLPRSIRMFCAHEEQQDVLYYSVITELDCSETDLQKIGTSKNPVMAKDTIFAQLVIRGSLNMYYYTSGKPKKDHYLVQEGDEKVIDLINNRYYADNGRTLLAYTEEYRKQLNQIFVSCPRMKSVNMALLTFTEKKIAEYIKKYNDCKERAPQAYQYKKENGLTSFGATAGASMGSVRFGFAYPAMPVPDLKKWIGYSIGIYGNFILPRTGKQWGIYTDLLYTSNTGTAPDATKHYNNGGYNVQLKDMKMQWSAIRLSLMLRRQFPKHKLNPFVQAGISISDNLSVSLSGKYIYPGLHSSDPQPTLSARSMEYAYNIGTGIGLQRLGAELRFRHGDGFTSGHLGSASNSSFLGILVSYKLL